ncbi:MAG: 1-acyl-sn-glycerol-3-phosphate acyltransferase [Saprospiraceae bacterium]|nr:1-acyl-sn-glycerol-3-phosphate acyltransferase [Saprospiraceae bacterium]
MQRLSNFLLRLWGFKLEGDPGNHLKHRIFAVIPHTSNWDFPLGLLVRSAAGIKVSYIGKSSLFKPPFGFIFRALGGYPVDRSRSHKYVDAVAALFQTHPQFSIAIAPEGTRKKVDRLKTGFYHIARLAGVPIIMTKFDYGRMVVAFSDPFYPTGDLEKDFAVMSAFYKDARGKNPELGFDFAQSKSDFKTKEN